MKHFFGQSAFLAAIVSALTTFLVMVITRREPGTRFVAANGCVMPSAPLDRSVDRLDLKNKSLREAIDLLSRQTGVLIQLRTQSLAAAGVDTEALVHVNLIQVTLARALDEILEAVRTDVKLDYWNRGDAIEIGTHGDEEAYVVTRVYDVQNLLKNFAQQGQDFWRTPTGFNVVSTSAIKISSAPLTLDEAQEVLVKLVSDNIAMQTWEFNGGTTGTMQCEFARLIVKQTPRNQDAIEALLYRLSNPESLRPPPTGIMLADHSLRWPTTQ